MDITEFRTSLAANNPPAGLAPALQAMWQAAKGNWANAHELVQAHEGEQPCDWIHAYLHRQEGDLSNAGYWYRRAKKPVNNNSLDEEWREITTELLKSS